MIFVKGQRVELGGTTYSGEKPRPEHGRPEHIIFCIYIQLFRMISSFITYTFFLKNFLKMPPKK